MITAQEQIDNMQFIHSLWLNELSHGGVTLSIFLHRLQQHELYFQTVEDPEELALIQMELEQLRLACEYTKKEVVKHINKIHKVARLNGELTSILNSSHDETKERIIQFRKDIEAVKEKFYKLVPHLNGSNE